MFDSIQKIIDLGMYPIPLTPRSKAIKQKGWPDTRIKSTAEFASLSSKWYGSNAIPNVGIINGTEVNIDGRTWYIVCVDLDSRLAVEMADDHLPETACCGRAGAPKSHRFFACDAPTTFRNYCGLDNKGDKTKGIDILGTARQAVVGPSIHPDTGEQWTDVEGQLCTLPLKYLLMKVSELNDAVCVESNTEAFKETSGQAPERKANPRDREPGENSVGMNSFIPLPSGFQYDSDSTESPLEQLNRAATYSDSAILLNTAGWSYVNSSGDKHFWKRPGATKDQNGNWKNGRFSVFTNSDVTLPYNTLGYSYCDLVGHVHCASNSDITSAVRGTEPSPDVIIKLKGEVNNLKSFPEPGGWLSEAADYIESISRRPSRQMAIVSAIAALGTAVGRVATVSDRFTGIYATMLCKSGRGKDTCLKFPKQLMEALGRIDCYSGNPGSKWTLDKMLSTNPLTLIVDDEGVLKGSGGANSVSSEVSSRMRTFYSAKPGEWIAPCRSQKTRQGERIFSPCLSYVSAITPMAFKQMIGDGKETGTLGRMLIAVVNDWVDAKRERDVCRDSIPKRLVDALTPWMNVRTINQLPRTKDGHLELDPQADFEDWRLPEEFDNIEFVEVGISDAADDVFHDVINTKWSRPDDDNAELYNRLGEQARVLAGLRAISRTPTKVHGTEVNVKDAEWAVEMMDCVTHNLINIANLEGDSES